MGQLKEERIRVSLVHKTQNQRGKNASSQRNESPRKILPRKLIVLRETDLNGWCPEEPLLLLAEGRILRGREGNNLLVHACRTNSLFFFFFFLFLGFCFSFYLSFFFFLSCYSSFLFPDFQVFNPILLPSIFVVTVHSKGFFL